MLCLGGVRRARHMVLTLDTFAEVLRGLKDLPTSSHGHLLYILERGTLNENENPYSLRAIADFLVGVDEYVDGAADLAEELAAFAREAGVKRSTKGGTNVARKKATADQEEEEKQPRRVKAVKKAIKPKRAAKKEKPKPEAKKAKKAKKARGPRNTPVPVEERLPMLLATLGDMKDGATINELFVRLTKTKAGEKLFPTRRSVKRALYHELDETVERSTPTVWCMRSKKNAAKAKSDKAKKAKAKKR